MPAVNRLGAIALLLASTACGGGRARLAGAAPAAAPPPAAPQPAPQSPSDDTTGLVRVRFAVGTTSGILNDSLKAGETRGYLIGADQGQVMMAHAITWPVRQGEAPPAAATVRVLAVDGGAELAAPLGAGGLWSGRLPLTGDYIVRVSATEATAYTLAVQIPRPLKIGVGDPTAAIAGTAPSRAPVDYLVAAEAGQTLAASVREDDPVTLHIYGLDGGEQLAALSERRQLWAGRVPVSEDYVISVIPADEGASYELTVALR